MHINAKNEQLNNNDKRHKQTQQLKIKTNLLFIWYCGQCFGMFFAAALAVNNELTGVLTNACSDNCRTFQREDSLLCRHLQQQIATQSLN